MRLHTAGGDIELRGPLPERLRRLRPLLPLGAIGYAKPANGARYGIVMKCGPAEAHAVKRQPPVARLPRVNTTVPSESRTFHSVR